MAMRSRADVFPVSAAVVGRLAGRFFQHFRSPSQPPFDTLRGVGSADR